jgi:hypothetical protein
VFKLQSIKLSPYTAFQWVAFLAQQILSQKLFGEEREKEKRPEYKDVYPSKILISHD